MAAVCRPSPHQCVFHFLSHLLLTLNLLYECRGIWSILVVTEAISLPLLQVDFFAIIRQPPHHKLLIFAM
jgi:hypothetical protein